ncbi:MAG: anti-sigma factor [Chloroflexi bacterium]|nr:anti-sigma factor [Chloroflexota bacterium]
MNCPEIEELRDLYVLGALTSDEAEAVEEHVSDCQDCRARIAVSWRAAQMLRQAVPERQPHPTRRRLLKEALDGESGSEPPLARPPGRSPAFFPTWRPLQLAAAVALVPLVASVWLSTQVLGLQRELQQNRTALERSWEIGQHAAEILGKAIEQGGAMTSLVGTEMAPAASGSFYYMPGDRDAVLVVSGLPQLEPGKVYQLWLQADQERVSGGTFYLEDDGAGMLVVKSPMPLASVQTLGITIEPRGGSTSPAGSRYMWGTLKNA